MSGNVAVRAGRWLTSRLYRRAEHPQLIVLPDKDAPELVADESYIRVSLSEFWLGTGRSWGFDRKPVVQAAAHVLFGKPDKRVPGATVLERQTFAVLVRPSAGQGVFRDYRITEWLPYRGQSVELEAALYSVLGRNRLLTAVDVISGFAPLVTPPVSAALAVADRVAAGIEKAVKANDAEPRLPLHTGLTAPGWVVVADAPASKLPSGELSVDSAGQLCRNGLPLTGCDYLVLRVEACRERKDWRTPDLDLAIAAALNARDNDGAKKVYKRLYDEALSRIYLSPDFTSSQRKKVAKVVKEELDDSSYGAAGDVDVTLAKIISRRGLPSDEEAEFLTLDELIAE